MRIRSLVLSAAAVATFLGLGSAVATSRTAAADPAALLMGIGNPHAGFVAATSPQAAAERRSDLAEWSELYSRDVWPGMGVANVHAAR